MGTYSEGNLKRGAEGYRERTVDWGWGALVQIFRKGWGLQRRVEDSEWVWAFLRGDGDLRKGFGGTKQGGFRDA